MSLDITKMLHTVVDLELTIDDAKELLIGPAARQQTIYVQLDCQLANFAQAAGWADVLDQEEHDANRARQSYLKALALLLLFSAKKQWTHLVVMDADQWQRVTTAKQSTKLADLNKEYLAIKHFLNGAYYSHRQEDFRHAWHLLLKMGMVDFSYQPEALQQEYLDLLERIAKQYEN
ncbi:MAG: hypothetical protein ACLRX6_07555 [Limosilactobacillus pontis]|uniref:dUTPase n=1 Tax=Limosilactobacillus pontis TaxID=35787 RepID=A0A2J6NQ49_9LACO|nr:hypothetical protein [Limosilactobacillus pontis]PMB83435.1 hypothetical protein CK797_01185 [Limosilactobacillus pontis]